MPGGRPRRDPGRRLPEARRACGAAGAWRAAAGVPFDGVWLDAAEAELRRRIAARTGDASDADLKVLEQQLARDPGEIGWRRTAG